MVDDWNSLDFDSGDHIREPSAPCRRGTPAAMPSADRIRIAGLDFNRMSEAEVVRYIIEASQVGKGGWVATPNIDICHQASRDSQGRAILSSATLIVPDGMPLLWAARLRGDRLDERVTGSSLIFTLSRAAARSGRSIYLLGGEPGVPDLAGNNLTHRYSALKVAGADAPPIGFDKTPKGIASIREKLLLAAPDIVYVGLGYPKQERLIIELASAMPNTWFVACGAAIPFAAGALRRAPSWMQRVGLEWAFRLLSEPRRLFRRYIVDDSPYAIHLLVCSALERARRRLTR